MVLVTVFFNVKSLHYSQFFSSAKIDYDRPEITQK